MILPTLDTRYKDDLDVYWLRTLLSLAMILIIVGWIWFWGCFHSLFVISVSIMLGDFEDTNRLLFIDISRRWFIVPD